MKNNIYIYFFCIKSLGTYKEKKNQRIEVVFCSIGEPLARSYTF